MINITFRGPAFDIDIDAVGWDNENNRIIIDQMTVSKRDDGFQNSGIWGVGSLYELGYISNVICTQYNITQSFDIEPPWDLIRKIDQLSKVFRPPKEVLLGYKPSTNAGSVDLIVLPDSIRARDLEDNIELVKEVGINDAIRMIEFME